MNAEHRRILCDKRDFLVERVNFQLIKPLLLDEELFSEYMLKDIASMEGLLDVLPQMGPKAFRCIVEILRKTEHHQEANALENCKIKLFYKMSSLPLGYCLIINNVEFDEGSANGPSLYRYGSDIDAESLNCFFEKAGFEVIKDSLRNMKAVDMTNYLKKFSKCEDLANVDSLIVVIMSHGAQIDNVDVIYGTDWGHIKKSHILDIFNNENCELLQNKPKIFIFVSCRGKSMDYGIHCQCIPNEDLDTGCKKSSKCNVLKCLPENVSLDARGNIVIPTITDTFIVHSTLPCQVSLRHHEEGSYFCQAFIHVLNKYYKIDDLHGIILSVNNKLLSKVSPEYGLVQSAHYEFLAARKKFMFTSF